MYLGLESDFQRYKAHKWSPQYFASKFGHHLVEVQMNRNLDEQFERHSPSLKQKNEDGRVCIKSYVS